MKLRFRDSSLRLRLNQREVAALVSGSAIEERIAFPGEHAFAYILEPNAQLEPQASFQQGVVRVSVPPGELRQWAAGDGIGIYFDLPAGKTALKVAIEKDLECIEGPPEERDPHAFPRTAGKNC
jgi:hypothetical protein